MTNLLRLLTININGIHSEHLSLQEQVYREDCDLVLVQETKIPPRFRWRLPGYRIYSCPGPLASHDGMAIHIKSSISHTTVSLLQFALLQVSALLIRIGGESTLVGSVYIPPRQVLPPQDLLALVSFHPAFILGGDFNAKHPSWHSSCVNPLGSFLFQHAIDHNYLLLGPLQPTHYPYTVHGCPEVLDIFAVKSSASLASIDTLAELNSDHSLVLLTLNTSAFAVRHLSPSRSITHWPAFSDGLKLCSFPLDPLLTSDSIDLAVDTFSSTISSLYRSSTTKCPLPVATLLPDLAPLLHRKQAAHCCWQAFCQCADKQLINALSTRIRTLIRTFEARSFTAAVDAAHSDRGLWSFLRRLHGSPSRTSSPIHGPRGLVFDTLDKANTLADTFDASFRSPVDDDDALPWIRHVQRTLRMVPPAQVDAPLPPFTVSEIVRIVKRSPSHRSPGPDFITYEMLRHLPLNALHYLRHLFACAFSLGYFPPAWKHGVVLAFPKPGKPPLFPQNRRHIQLLSTLGKTFERLLYRRIFPFVLRSHIIPDEQFGFVPTCSTTHQTLRLVEHISSGFNAHLSTLAIFLDVQKAYDSTWHSGLFYKLRAFNFPTALQAIIRSFLFSHSFWVSEDRALSSSRRILAGVPQGAVLSPLLYTIFTADIPWDTFASGKNLVYLHRRVQRHLDAVLSWASKWCLSIGAQKTQAIVFTKRRYLDRLPRLSVSDVPIEYSPHVTYLGVTFDRHLTWARHVESCRRKFFTKFAHATPLFLSPVLPVSTKLHIYHQYLRSSLTYASPAWLGIARRRLQSLQVLQNHCLRLISGHDRSVSILQLHADLEVDFLFNFIVNDARRFYLRALGNSNPFISDLGAYDPRDYPAHRMPLFFVR